MGAMPIGVGLGLLILVACTGPAPKQDYVIAKTALEASRQAGAPQYAAGVWDEALRTYSEAERAYDDRRYDEAQELFLESLSLSEKAENLTRLRKFKSGEGAL